MTTRRQCGNGCGTMPITRELKFVSDDRSIKNLGIFSKLIIVIFNIKYHSE